MMVVIPSFPSWLLVHQLRGGSIIDPLYVNDTFFKCKFSGILLTYSSQDSNNQIFPLAFAIVDSENDASWT